ncbi:MAG TPA: NADH-quinone oxidoreductase subunit C [Rhodocyclaceae bacterium]|jgi:NADH-quinone oxidoreductase subunit C|nr:NADH-quinone oxidoreductase subunit C [Rhodocyclaceae bacterium]
MSARLEQLRQSIESILGERALNPRIDRGELTVEAAPADYVAVARMLRDHPDLAFEELIDLTGVDYSTHARGAGGGRRYAAVCHLLSIQHNRRMRLRVFAENDDFPVLDSLVEVWPGVNWYEREAFDLLGIMFSGHPDLRRILTDYGFIGHPFRKDFPVSGYVEMRYDPDQQRVVYQPVSIEPREVTPRIVREENYGDVGNG